MREGLRARTLAIGDGANDVPMIQSANVGMLIFYFSLKNYSIVSCYLLYIFNILRQLNLTYLILNRGGHKWERGKASCKYR